MRFGIGAGRRGGTRLAIRQGRFEDGLTAPLAYCRDEDLDRFRDGNGDESSDHPEERREDDHGDDGKKWVDLDGLLEDLGRDEVVLDLLVEDENGARDDTL